MFGHGYEKEPAQRNWGDPGRADVTVLMLGGGCQVDVVQDVGSRALWTDVVGRPQVELLNLSRAKDILLPDGREATLSGVPELRDDGRLLTIAEGLAHKVIDIPEYGITTRPFLEGPRTHREPLDGFFEGHWW
jgi:hypothetical protein